MKDKGFELFLIILFSVIGIAILAIVWARQMPLPERLINITAGSGGLLIALTRVSLLKLPGNETNRGQVSYQAESENS